MFKTLFIALLTSSLFTGCDNKTNKNTCTYCHGWEDTKYSHATDSNSTLVNRVLQN